MAWLASFRIRQRTDTRFMHLLERPWLLNRLVDMDSNGRALLALLKAFVLRDHAHVPRDINTL